MQSTNLSVRLSFCLVALLLVPWRPGVQAANELPDPAVELTLKQALRMAVERNPGLRGSTARREAAAGRAVQAGRWTNPELELTVDDWPVGAEGGFSDAKQTVGIAQTLPWPGKKRLEREVGRLGVRIAEAEWALRRTELMRDVRAAFAAVLVAERRVAVAGELVTVAHSAAAIARKRVEAGATAYQEQLRAEIQAEQARSEERAQQLEQATARQSLASLLGLPDLGGALVVGALPEAADPRLLRAATAEQLENHPSLTAARTYLESAETQYRRTRLEPYPDVRAAVGGGRLGETDQSLLQLQLSIPLPVLDTSAGLQAEARAQVAAAEADLTAVRLQLHRELARALQRYQAALDQVASYRDRILPRANEALRLVQTGFEEGKFGFIDLLDTQRTFAEARLVYHQKILELSVAQAELEALLQPELVSSTTTSAIPAPAATARP